VQHKGRSQYWRVKAIETGCVAGNGQHQGRLSAQDEKVMKRYQTDLTIFNDSAEVDTIMSWLRGRGESS